MQNFSALKEEIKQVDDSAEDTARLTKRKKDFPTGSVMPITKDNNQNSNGGGPTRRPSMTNKASMETSKNSRNQSKRINTQKLILDPTEKLSEIISLRNKVFDEYTKITFKTFGKGKKQIINKWKQVLELTQNFEIKLFLTTLKCLGDIYLEFDEYEIAKNYYFYYKFFANYLEMLEDVMIAYESLGNVYKFLFQYEKAIHCYKKQIEVAWIVNNKESELRAFDNIGIQYFYLGNKDKAKYYHERMLYGRSENQKSEIRESVCIKYRNKNFHMFNEDKLVKNMKTNDDLKERLKEALSLSEESKAIDLESADVLVNQESMKNSFVSEVDMTFAIISEKYLKDEENDSLPVIAGNNKEKDSK